MKTSSLVVAPWSCLGEFGGSKHQAQRRFPPQYCLKAPPHSCLNHKIMVQNWNGKYILPVSVTLKLSKVKQQADSSVVVFTFWCVIKSHTNSNSGFEVHCGLFPTHILLQLISPWGQPLACSLHSGFCRSTALVVLHSSNSFRLHCQNPTLEIKTLNNQFVEQKHLQFPMLLLLMQKVLWLPSALNSIIPIFYPHEMLLLF